MKLTIDTKWIEAFSEQDDTVRLAMYDAMFAYLEGKEPMLSSENMMMFFIIKPFLDEEANKRIRLAERSKENGKKGGRPKEGKKEAPKQEPKEPIGFRRFLDLDEYKERSDNLRKLDKWIEDNTPYIFANLKPLKQKEFDKLFERYGIKEICDTLMNIENRKDLRKRYTNLYLTLNNWLKNEFSRKHNG